MIFLVPGSSPPHHDIHAGGRVDDPSMHPVLPLDEYRRVFDPSDNALSVPHVLEPFFRVSCRFTQFSLGDVYRSFWFFWHRCLFGIFQSAHYAQTPRLAGLVGGVVFHDIVMTYRTDAESSCRDAYSDS